MPPRRAVKMSDEHKKALAAGRSQGLAVRKYLQALDEAKPRRGRRPSQESVTKQLAEIDAKLSGADPLQRLHLLQQRKNLESRLGGSETGVDFATLEDGFVAAAAEYGARKGINYSTWREIGVPADVLRRAGISRVS